MPESLPKPSRPRVNTSSEWTGDHSVSSASAATTTTTSSSTSSSTATTATSTPLTSGTSTPFSGTTTPFSSNSSTTSPHPSIPLLTSLLLSKTKSNEEHTTTPTNTPVRPTTIHRSTSHTIPQFNTHGHVLEPMSRKYGIPDIGIDVEEALSRPALPRTHSYELEKAKVGEKGNAAGGKGELKTVEENASEEGRRDEERMLREKERSRLEFEKVKQKLRGFCIQ